MIRVKGIEETMKRIRQERDSIVARERDKILNSVVEDLKEATPVRTGRAKAGWEVKDGHIVNEVPYIEDLNIGSSIQAPALFIEATVLRHRDVKPNGTIVKST